MELSKAKEAEWVTVVRRWRQSVKYTTYILHTTAKCFGRVAQTWSLTLREERRLRVFENRMLRRIFGAERKRQVEKTT